MEEAYSYWKTNGNCFTKQLSTRISEIRNGDSGFRERAENSAAFDRMSISEYVIYIYIYGYLKYKKGLRF